MALDGTRKKRTFGNGGEVAGDCKKSEGSWWDDWLRWLATHSGENITATKKFGNARYAPIEDAPGSYVRTVLPNAGEINARHLEAKIKEK